MLTPSILLGGQYLLWNSLYNLNDSFGNLKRNDMYTYILIVFALNNILTWSSENSLSKEIRTGGVVSRLIRPVPFLLQIVSEMLGNIIIQGSVNFVMVFFLGVLFYKLLYIPSIVNILLFIPYCILGIILRILLVEVFSLFCFFTTGHLGITWVRKALFEFFSGALIPLTIFPLWLKRVAYITPFPYMIQVPVSIFFNDRQFDDYLFIFFIQNLWIVFFVVCHTFLFKNIQKKFTIAGG